MAGPIYAKNIFLTRDNLLPENRTPDGTAADQFDPEVLILANARLNFRASHLSVPASSFGNLQGRYECDLPVRATLGSAATSVV